MTAIQVYLVNLKCDGCGTVAILLAPDVRRAREVATTWTLWRKKNSVYDICPKCRPPEGARPWEMK